MKNKKIYIDLLTKSTGECSVRKQFGTSRPWLMYYICQKCGHIVKHFYLAVFLFGTFGGKNENRQNMILQKPFQIQLL